MKRLTIKLVLTLVAVVFAVAMSSCSKKDKTALMKCVPADAYFMTVMDGNKLWEQCEISIEDDDVTIGKDLEKVLKLNGVDKSKIKEIKEVLRVVNMTEKTYVVFGYDEEVWFTFFVDDQEEFIKTVEELPHSKAAFDEEKDFMVYDYVAIKDNQVWICTSQSGEDDIDLKQINKFMDLDKEKCFVGKFETLAEEFSTDDVTMGMFANLDEIKSAIHSSDVQEFSLVQSILFDDSKYVVGKARLTDTQVSVEIRVLNSKMQPAKFNLPLAKIDANGMAHIDGNAPILAATAIDSKMIDTIINLMDKNGLLSSSDKTLLESLKQLDGTFALSLTNLNDFAFSQQYVSEDAVKENGQVGLNTLASAFWGTENPFTVSAAGKTLIVRSKDSSATAGGKVPTALVGQYIGVFVDFKKADKMIKGVDLSKLGTMYMTIGPDGNGIKFTAVWDINAPLKSVLQTIEKMKEVNVNNLEFIGLDQWEQMFDNRNSYGYDAYEVDSVAYDPYYSYYEEPVAVEEVAEDYYGY